MSYSMAIQFLDSIHSQLRTWCQMPSGVATVALQYFVNIEQFKKQWDPKYGLTPERFIQIFLEGDCFRDRDLREKGVVPFPTAFFLTILRDNAKTQQEERAIVSLYNPSTTQVESMGCLLDMQDLAVGRLAINVFNSKGSKTDPYTDAPYEGHYLKCTYSSDLPGVLSRRAHLSGGIYAELRILVCVNETVNVFSKTGGGQRQANPKPDFTFPRLPPSSFIIDACLVEDTVFVFHCTYNKGLCVTRQVLSDQASMVPTLLTNEVIPANSRCFLHERTSVFYFITQNSSQAHSAKPQNSPWVLNAFDCHSNKTYTLPFLKNMNKTEIDSIHVQGELMAVSGRKATHGLTEVWVDLVHLTNPDFNFRRMVVRDTVDPLQVRLYQGTLYAYSQKTTKFYSS